MSSLKQKVVKGVFWALLERLGVQGVGFIVSMVLARLLSPSDYGTIALLSIFIAIAGCLADSGFGTALVQKKEVTELDFNSVFYLSLVASGVLYAVLFFSAPMIARFYATPVLIPVLRVISLSVILNAINSVQNAELQRKLLFDKSFRISLIGVVATGVIGVTLAYLGYGVWALVWSRVVGGIIGMLTRWYFIAWRPQLIFSWESLRGLFKFGWKMALSGFLDTTYNNLYGLLIGRIYSKNDLAFVNRGQAIPSLAMNSINGTLVQVSFPALAQIQDRRDTLREAMRKMIRISTFFVFPMMTGVACTADSLVYLLFGDQWMPSVPYVRLACFTYALWPFHSINLQAIKAIGRSDLFLYLEIIKKMIGLITLFASMHFGVWWMMAVGAFVLGPLSVIVNAWPNRKLLGYSIGMQVKDVLSTAVLCTVMALFVVPVSYIFVPAFVRLPVQVVVGALAFASAAIIFKVQPLREAFSIIEKRLPKVLSQRICGFIGK